MSASPELPDDVIDIIICNNNDKLILRNVNTTFRNIVDVHIQNYEDDLCKLLQAMRISAKTIPKKWLMRYTFNEQNANLLPMYVCAKCKSNINELGTCANKACHSVHSIPTFPWERVLQGPIATVMVIVAILYFKYSLYSIPRN